jgi:hypothetical protein
MAHVVMHDSGRSISFYTKRRNFILGVGMGMAAMLGYFSLFLVQCFLPVLSSGSIWIIRISDGFLTKQST